MTKPRFQQLGKANKMGSTVAQRLRYFASFQYLAINLHDPAIFLLLQRDLCMQTGHVAPYTFIPPAKSLFKPQESIWTTLRNPELEGKVYLEEKKSHELS